MSPHIPYPLVPRYHVVISGEEGCDIWAINSWLYTMNNIYLLIVVLFIDIITIGFVKTGLIIE